MFMQWKSKLIFKNLTKALSYALSLIVVFTLFSSPSLAVKTSMTGDYAKDIALVRFLKNNFDVHFSNII